ncbi:MAG: hypothetical protein ACJ8AO_07020, partial [Gemmatimonadaceae bacterium]
MLTVQTATRADVWSAPECAGGKRLAVVGSATQLRGRSALGLDLSLSLAVPLDDPSADHFLQHRVLRVEGSDGVVDEWRIASVRRDAEPGQVVVECDGFPVFLGSRALVSQKDGDGVVRYNFDVVGSTLSELVDDYVVAAMATTGIPVARGTLDADPAIDLSFSWDSPLSALKKLEQLAGLELTLRRNGATGYYVDFLTAIGAGAAALDARLGKNLLASALAS